MLDTSLLGEAERLALDTADCILVVENKGAFRPFTFVAALVGEPESLPSQG